MPNKRKKDKPTQRRSTKPGQVNDHSISIGDISGSTGIAIGEGAQSNVLQMSGAGSDEISGLFRLLREKAAQLPEGPEKTIAGSALKELEAEAKKGEQANEHTVQKWMIFLAEAAPDIWDVAIDTFINPVKGFATVFRKIAEKAKAKGNASQESTD